MIERILIQKKDGEFATVNGWVAAGVLPLVAPSLKLQMRVSSPDSFVRVEQFERIRWHKAPAQQQPHRR